MSSQEHPAQEAEAVESEGSTDEPTQTVWEIEGVDLTLTPLQFHCLTLLQRIILLKNSYQTDPDYEQWLMSAINKSIYATLRDCIEANVGDQAKEFLRNEHQVN